jgi:hypothetical protein
MLRGLLLARIVLLVAPVVMLIHVLGVPLRIPLGLLAVDVIGALGLGEAVNFTAGETREELLGELVGDGLACGEGGDDG